MRRRPDVAPTQLAARPVDEVRDALLRLDAFVDVVVAGEHDVDAVLDEQRLEDDAQLDLRAVPAAVRIERMVEVADLPVIGRLLERVVEPRQLLRVHLVAVEHEEADVLLRVGVVPLAAHVEAGVQAVVGTVVVAERRVEDHARRQQRRVRPLELRDEVLRLLPAVDVVAEHDHQLEREASRAPHSCARPRRTAVRSPVPVVADDRELQRIGARRQRRRLLRRRGA